MALYQENYEEIGRSIQNVCVNKCESHLQIITSKYLKKKRNTYRYMTAEHRIQGSLEIFVCKSLWQVFN